MGRGQHVALACTRGRRVCCLRNCQHPVHERIRACRHSRPRSDAGGHWRRVHQLRHCVVCRTKHHATTDIGCADKQELRQQARCAKPTHLFARPGILDGHRCRIWRRRLARVLAVVARQRRACCGWLDRGLLHRVFGVERQGRQAASSELQLEPAGRSVVCQPTDHRGSYCGCFAHVLRAN